MLDCAFQHSLLKRRNPAPGHPIHPPPALPPATRHSCCSPTQRCGDVCCPAGQSCLAGRCLATGSTICGSNICGPGAQCVNGRWCAGGGGCSGSAGGVGAFDACIPCCNQGKPVGHSTWTHSFSAFYTARSCAGTVCGNDCCGRDQVRGRGVHGGVCGHTRERFPPASLRLRDADAASTSRRSHLLTSFETPTNEALHTPQNLNEQFCNQNSNRCCSNNEFTCGNTCCTSNTEQCDAVTRTCCKRTGGGTCHSLPLCSTRVRALTSGQPHSARGRRTPPLSLPRAVCSPRSHWRHQGRRRLLPRRPGALRQHLL